MTIENKIRKLAKERGIQVIGRANGHWSLIGPLTVNYYPLSLYKTAYIAGTNKGKKHVTPEQAIEMCFDVPAGLMPTPRAKNYKKIRKRMLLKSHLCHWCQTPLTLESSTLDHVIPLSKGGLDNHNNRVLACEPCNSKRGNSMPELKLAETNN